MANLSDYIGEELTIAGVTGRLMRVQKGNIAVLYDGKRNRKVEVPELSVKVCSHCKRKKSVLDFKQYASGDYTAMCDRCRLLNYDNTTDDELKKLKKPKIYLPDNLEPLDIIKAMLSPVEYIGYLKGDILAHPEDAQYYYDKLEELKHAQ